MLGSKQAWQDIVNNSKLRLVPAGGNYDLDLLLKQAKEDEGPGRYGRTRKGPLLGRKRHKQGGTPIFGYKGVTKVSHGKKFRAQICFEGKVRHRNMNADALKVEVHLQHQMRNIQMIASTPSVAQRKGDKLA